MGLNSEERLRKAMVGETFRHFKGKKYKVLDITEDSETQKVTVIYQALYKPYKKYNRSAEMFLSEIDKEKHPNAKQKYRFEIEFMSFKDNIIKCLNEIVEFNLFYVAIYLVWATLEFLFYGELFPKTTDTIIVLVFSTYFFITNKEFKKLGINIWRRG